MLNPSYSDKLKSPHWQKVRLKVFERDEWTCQHCKDKETQLQVHHLDYIPGIKVYEYPLDMLVSLCSVCHERENKRPKYETDLITSLKINGFLAFHVWNLATKLHNDKRFREHLKTVLQK